MQNFYYSIPTKIYFGRGQIEQLRTISEIGTKALLVYGGGSIKKIGVYQKVIEILNEIGMKYIELSGVEPNPRIESVRQGVLLCKENNLDVILAVGGGSVIDCSKMIAAGAYYEGDAWDLVLDNSKIKKALPIAVVLTLAATGSEMDAGAVITNFAEKAKLAGAAECTKPTFSILDPVYTMSVSKRMTAAGVADIMSHLFENYFTNEKGAFVQARFCESLLKTCIKYGPIAYNEPDNYEARANLMWASSLAINGICQLGQSVGWTVHPIEHELSAYYDITHGEGLAILTPIWMKYVLSQKTVDKFAEYGINVWGISSDNDPFEIATSAISKTALFFKSLGLPETLRDVGIVEDINFEEMALHCESRTLLGYVPLTHEDTYNIYQLAK